MTTAATAERPVTVSQLITALEEYIRHNTHSNDPRDRWFTHHIETETLPIARHVCNGKLTPDLAKRVNAFRAAEIEKEIEAKKRAIEVLERDLKPLRTAV